MLEYKLRDPTQLPFEILEQAHWRPAEVQLCCKYKPTNAARPEFRRLRKFWRQKEVFFNFALDALLFTLPPEDLAKFGNSISNLGFMEARLFGGYSMALKKIIGVPDFLIADTERCILGEIKVSAGYDYQQFVKYQTFAALSRILDHLPNNFEHVVVVQDDVECAFIKDYEKNWTPKVIGSQLQLDGTLKQEAARIVRENIRTLGSRLNQETVFGRYVQNWDDDDLLTNTAVFTWPEFARKMGESTGRKDLAPFVLSIQNLGMGVVEFDQDC